MSELRHGSIGSPDGSFEYEKESPKVNSEVILNTAVQTEDSERRGESRPAELEISVNFYKTALNLPSELQ